MPLVSVIIPTYRREELVVNAIQSVLDGCSLDFELLVFDDTPDASARDAVSAIADERITYHVMAEPSGGCPALVRNTAIAHARGKYLYFLDDDDQSAPAGIDALIRALERSPSRGVAFGKVECVGPSQATRARYNAWYEWAARTSYQYRWSSRLTAGIVMFRGTLLLNSACAIRREVATKLGGFDTTMPLFEDVDFFIRGIRTTGHVFVNEPVLIYGTGRPSLIHDINEDWSRIGSSYEIMHNKYKQRHGMLDYRSLQIACRLLPIGDPVALANKAQASVLASQTSLP